MVDFRINVVIDSRNAATGASAIERRLMSLERRALSLKSMFGRLGGALGAALTFRAIQEQLDGYTALQNRLRAVTRAGEDLGKVNEDLLQVANRSRSSLQEVGRIYSRLSIGAKNLGISQAELIDFTETLSKTIAISGATSYEAAGALTQFSQAMASSALRGDELRAILEQLPEVSNVIAKRFGVSSGELAKLGEQGLITSKQIIAAFKDAREEIEERFSRTAPTIAQAFTVLKNQILVTLGELDKASGFSETFAKSIIFLAKNIDVVIQVVQNLALFLGPRYLLGAVTKLFAVIAANPVGILIAAISIAAAVVPDFQAKLDALTASVVEFAQTVTGIDFSNLSIGQIFEDTAMSVAAAIDGIVGGVMGMWEVFVEFYYTFVTQPKVAGELLLKGFRDGIEKLIDYVVATFQTIGDVILGVFRGIIDVVRNAAGAAGALLSGNVEAAKAFSDDAQASVLRTLNVFTTIPGRFKSNLMKLEAADLLPTVKLSEAGEAAGERLANAFAQGIADSGTPAQDALKKLFAVNTSTMQQLGLQAAQAFGTGVMLFRDQSQESIQNALLGPVRFPGMTPDNPRFTPQKRGFGARPDAPAGATIEPPPQGLAANLAAAGRAPEDPYARSLENLKAIVAVEATRITQNDLIAAQLQARFEVEREGVTLSAEQVAELDKFVQLSRDAQALSSLTEQLDQKRQLVEQERLLNELLRARPDLQQEVNNRLIQTRIAALEASTAMGDGFERAFLKLSQAANDYASAAEQIVTGFADRATDAITEFVTTGKLNFREFAVAILQDITKIIIRLLVLKAIEAGLGIATGGASLAASAGANAAAGAAGGAGRRAKGGTVQPARSYIVGEEGPEIFVPNKTGTIVPNQQQAAPPQVNVQVVNVEDPKKIPQTISGGGADEAILNVLSRRRDAVKRTLG